MNYFVNSNYIKVYPTAYRNQAYSWVNNAPVPITDSVSFNPESRLNSEFNITNLTLRLSTKDSYVIRQEVSSESAIYPSALYFCVGGYWFSLLEDGVGALVNSSTGQFKNNNEVHVYIKITALNGTNYTGKEYEAYSLTNLNHSVVNILDEKINPSGEDFQFCGLGFSETVPDTNTYTHELKLLEKKDGKWRVPATSLLQITTQEIEDKSNVGKNITEIFTTKQLQVNGTSEITGNTEIKGITSVTNSTSSTNSSTGALKITGGVGVGENLNVGGNVNITGTETVNNNLTTYGDFYIKKAASGSTAEATNFSVDHTNGNTDIAGTLDVGGDTTITGDLSIICGTNTTFSIECYEGDMELKGDITAHGDSIIFDGITKPTDNSLFPLTIDKNGAIVGTNLTQEYDCSDTTGLKVITGINLDTTGKISSCDQTDIPIATGSALGVVKSSTTGTTDNRNYNVQVNDDGTMKVNVPWTDTTPVSAGSKNTTYYIIGAAKDGNSNLIHSLKIANDSGVYFTTDNNNISTLRADYLGANRLQISDGTHSVFEIITDGTNTAPIAHTSGSLRFGSNTYYGSNTTYSISTAGACTMNSFKATSDRRLKDNIKLFESKKSILDLPVVEFDFKEDGSHHIGCIAQDLQNICPELVSETENGYLTIEENKLVYLLLDEVKKLKMEINKLKGKGE